MNNFEELKDDVMKSNDIDAIIGMITSTIVGKLMAKRDRIGMSQRQLSELSGVPQKTISLIESGKTIPKLYTLIKLAKTLEMEITMDIKSN